MRIMIIKGQRLFCVRFRVEVFKIYFYFKNMKDHDTEQIISFYFIPKFWIYNFF